MSYASGADTQLVGTNTQFVGTRRRENKTRALVSAYIIRKFKPLKNGAYHLANAACIDSIRTAEGWLSGRSTPHDDDLLNLCITCQDLQMELHDLCVQMRNARSN